MQTSKFDVTDADVEVYNDEGKFLLNLREWLYTLTGSREVFYTLESFFREAGNKLAWRDGGPCLAMNAAPKLGVEDGRLYLRWTRSFNRLGGVYQITGSTLEGLVKWGEHTRELPVNCPREFNQTCKNVGKIFYSKANPVEGEYICRYYLDDVATGKPDFIAAVPYGMETIYVPMRERLGSFLQDKAGVSLEVIDQITAKIWEELAKLSEPPTLSILEGSDVIEAYEQEIGGESCMTSRTENIEIYELNPSQIKLATIETSRSSARCLLWYTDCGHVVADRVYLEGSLSPAHMHACLTMHFEGSDLTFVPNRGNGQTYYISNLELPASRRLPYLDTAMWRQTGEDLVDMAINPTGAGWEGQCDYENGGRLAYPEEQCYVCGEYYNPEDDDSSGTLASGDTFCGCCHDNGAVVWVESDSEYYHEDDCRWSAFSDSHIHRANAVYISDTDEYVHDSDMEDWARGRLDDTDLPTSQVIIDAIILHYRHEQ